MIKATVTFPSDAAVAIPLGSVFKFEQNSTGTLTFTATIGGTLLSRGDLYKSNGARAIVFAEKMSYDTWRLWGDLTA